MKANNKKQTKKLLPWLASISFFAVGAMAIMPMATACSNTPPEPSYAEDPTDPNAFLMVGGFNYEQKVEKTPFFTTIQPLPDSKKMVFRSDAYTSATPMACRGFFDEGKPFKDAEYIEIGENFASQKEKARDDTFQIEYFANMNIKKLVLRHMGGEAKDEKIGYQIFLDGQLNGIHEIFFDFPPNELVFGKQSTATKFFTTDPDAIYIRKGKGTVEEWKEKFVGLSNDKIIKVVA